MALKWPPSQAHTNNLCLVLCHAEENPEPTPYLRCHLLRLLVVALHGRLLLLLYTRPHHYYRIYLHERTGIWQCGSTNVSGEWCDSCGGAFWSHISRRVSTCVFMCACTRVCTCLNLYVCRCAQMSMYLCMCLYMPTLLLYSPVGHLIHKPVRYRMYSLCSDTSNYRVRPLPCPLQLHIELHLPKVRDSIEHRSSTCGNCEFISK